MFDNWADPVVQYLLYTKELHGYGYRIVPSCHSSSSHSDTKALTRFFALNGRAKKMAR